MHGYSRFLGLTWVICICIYLKIIIIINFDQSRWVWFGGKSSLWLIKFALQWLCCNNQYLCFLSRSSGYVFAEIVIISYTGGYYWDFLLIEAKAQSLAVSRLLNSSSFRAGTLRKMWFHFYHSANIADMEITFEPFCWCGQSNLIINLLFLCIIEVQKVDKPTAVEELFHNKRREDR